MAVQQFPGLARIPVGTVLQRQLYAIESPLREAGDDLSEMPIGER